MILTINGKLGFMTSGLYKARRGKVFKIITIVKIITAKIPTIHLIIRKPINGTRLSHDTTDQSSQTLGNGIQYRNIWIDTFYVHTIPYKIKQ